MSRSAKCRQDKPDQNLKNVSFGLQRNTPRALKYLPQYLFFTEKTIGLLEILKKIFCVCFFKVWELCILSENSKWIQNKGGFGERTKYI